MVLPDQAEFLQSLKHHLRHEQGYISIWVQYLTFSYNFDGCYAHF